jgi:hypothetical protein
MPVHVVTARIYTGDVFYLGKVASGLLGGWCAKVSDAEQFTEGTRADRVFDALLVYLSQSQPIMGRSLFDPWVLKSLYERARVVEFGVARVDGECFQFQRRRAVQLVPLDDPFRNNPARRMAAVA